MKFPTIYGTAILNEHTFLVILGSGPIFSEAIQNVFGLKTLPGGR